MHVPIGAVASLALCTLSLAQTSVSGPSSPGSASPDGPGACTPTVRAALVPPPFDVRAMVEFDDGTGLTSYIGGSSAARLWNGAWESIDAGLDIDVRSLAVFDDGSGPALYAGGMRDFGLTPSGIHRWNGSGWVEILGPIIDIITSLVAHDDGSGERLYIGGSIPLFTNPILGRVLAYDGSTFTQVGGGLWNSVSTRGEVFTMASFDDGSGPALYVGGDFDLAGSASLINLARWDGSAWGAVGAFGGDGLIFTMTSFQATGQAPQLVVGGQFFFASGGAVMRNITAWNGAGWQALGSGIGSSFFPLVRSLASYDDGNGAALYASGDIGTAGGVPVNNIAGGTERHGLP